MKDAARLIQWTIVVVLGAAAALVALNARKDSSADRQQRLASDDPSRASTNATRRPADAPARPSPSSDDDGNPLLAAARAANEGHEPWVTPAGAVDLIGAEILDALAEGPVNAVWLFDRTESAERLRDDAARELAKVLARLGELPMVASARRANAQSPGGDDGQPNDADSAGSPRLLLGVCSYAGKLHLGVGKLTADIPAIQAELKRLSTDPSGAEMTFTALLETIERITAPHAQRRHTIITIVTDEIGDDADQVDATVDLVKRQAATVYVIGPSSPFGRDDTLGVGRDIENLQPVRRGPETVGRELLELDDVEITGDLYKFDSGFGPYALARLCQASGGQYLRIDPLLRSTKLFPIENVRRLDAAAMARYRPDYLSRAEYQRLLSSNAACRALVEATRAPPIPIRQELKLEFAKTSEPELKRTLDEAQRAVARIEPKLRQLWTTLSTGKADRDKLPSPRWKASYDLALGRLLATRCRVEGYNIACAQLKQGRVSGAADRRTWVLAPSDDGLGDSSLEKMIKEARTQLARVQAEHPGTPWALMAERELNAPLGWKWQDR